MKFGNQKIKKRTLVLIVILAILLIINIWFFAVSGELRHSPACPRRRYESQ